MADDERRAEIEAVLRALVESEHAPHYGSEHCVCGPQATPAKDCPAHWAIAVVERLQDAARVRDARGDDEVRYAEVSFGPEAIVTRDDMLAARSPQGEDHEAGRRAAMDSLDAIDGRRWAGATRSEVVDLVLAAYLSRVSPSRDGSVAVEDVIAAYRRWDGRSFADRREALLSFPDFLRAEFSPASTGDRDEAS